MGATFKGLLFLAGVLVFLPPPPALAETIEEELAALDKKIQDGQATAAEQERFNYLLENFDHWEWKNPKNVFPKLRLRLNGSEGIQQAAGAPMISGVQQQSRACGEFKNVYYNCADLPWDAADPWNRTSDEGSTNVRPCSPEDSCVSDGVLVIDSRDDPFYYRAEETLLDRRFASVTFRMRQTISDRRPPEPDGQYWGGGVIWLDDGVKSIIVGFGDEYSGRRIVLVATAGSYDPETGEMTITDVLTAYHDWSNWREYRLVRDAQGMIELFVDGGQTPLFTFPYYSLSMPTFGSPSVAYGHLIDGDNSRVTSEYDFINYSVGMPDTEGCWSEDGKMQMLSLVNINGVFKPGCMTNDVLGVFKIKPVEGVASNTQSHDYTLKVERTLQSASGAVVRTLTDTVHLGPLGTGANPAAIRAAGLSAWDGAAAVGVEVAEGEYNYGITFSVMRADKKQKEKVLSSISATGSPVIMTQSIPFGLPAPIYTYCRDTDLRKAVAPWTDPTSEAPLTTEWNYSDNVRSLWGKNLNIRPTDVGCTQSDLSEAVKCVLLHFSAYVGITDPADLQFEHETVEPDGDRVFRYSQLYSGLPVEGSNVIVRTTPTGALTSVFSTAVAGIIGGPQPPAASATADDSEPLAAKATQLNGGVPLVVVEDSPVVWIDRSKKNSRAHAARKLVLSDPAGELFDGVFVVETGRFESFEKRGAPYAAPQHSYTKVVYPYHTTEQCGTDMFCGIQYSCDAESSPAMCVNMCTVQSECRPDWRCWGAGLEGDYCFLQDNDSKGTLFYWDPPGTWVREGYQYHEPFANLVAATNDVRAFHYEVLNRAGWANDSNSPYVSVINSNCCSRDDASCSYYGGCDDSAHAYGSYVQYNNWKYYFKDWANLNPKIRGYRVTGHEWGHNIIRKTAGAVLSGAECLSENLADMFGSLFAVWKLGGSDRVADTGCYRSPWRDDTSGLSPSCVDLKYAQRSRLDWMNCAVDDHFNRFVWTRFLRVLAEGTATFNKDGNGEDVGVSFTSFGVTGTTRVFYDAVLHANSQMNLRDWVERLKSAGYAKGGGKKVETALGIVGFVEYTVDLYGQSDQAPNKRRFNAWTSSSNKNVHVWKDKNSGNIKVGYYVGSTFTAYTFAANTDVSPAVVEYNNRLHIFWRDKDTKGINVKWIDGDGTKSVTYFLGTKGLYSAGGFDAAIFNGKLYLVYVDPTDMHVRLAKCSSTTGCGANAFTNPAGGVNYVDLGYRAYPGVAADAGPGLNGTAYPTAPFLYVVSSINESTDRYRIRIDQVSAGDVRMHQGFTVMVPGSYKTNSQVAARLFKSAFNNGYYLHLGWKNLFGVPGTGAPIFASVVQTYNDVDNLSTQITAPADTFLRTLSGIRFPKGAGSYSDLLEFVDADASSNLKVSVREGRY